MTRGRGHRCRWVYEGPSLMLPQCVRLRCSHCGRVKVESEAAYQERVRKPAIAPQNAPGAAQPPKQGIGRPDA